MNGRIYFGYSFAILVVFCDIISAQQFCTRIEFSRESFGSKFRACPNKLHTMFTIKDFNQNFKPNRTNHKQYLTNSFAYSCAELIPRLRLNFSSSIEASIFLKSINDEFVEIILYDADTNTVAEKFKHTGTGNWFPFKCIVHGNIMNARVNWINSSKNLIVFYYCVTLTLLFSDRNHRQQYDTTQFIGD